MTPNLAAFLTMIAHGEGVDRAADPYRVCFTFRHTILDLNWHPAEHRPPAGAIEWGGETLRDEQCAAVGLSPGCVSTAAGRYQITRPTWLDIKERLHLTNFGPDAQDDAGIALIKRCGALDFVNGGQIPEAIELCSVKWASLPGSTAKQPQKTMAALLDVFEGAGGLVA